MKMLKSATFAVVILSFIQVLLPEPTCAAPRPPYPPWPQATLSIYGFDDAYWGWPYGTLGIGESTATLSDSWSGYALNRDALSTLPVAIPGVSASGKTEVAPGSGAIRFWYAPNWTSANKELGGAGPGHYSPLVEMVNLGSKTYDVRWSLGVEAGGNTIYLAQFGEKDMKTFLQAPVQFQAGQWRLITLCYSPKATAIYVDGEVVAKGEGVSAPASWEEKSLGIVVGSDLAMQMTAEGQFDELMTFDKWPKLEDEAFYFKGVSQQVALGPVPPEEEQALYEARAKRRAEREAEAAMMRAAWSEPANPCVTNGPVYLTNIVTVFDTNQSWTVAFDIAGGTNGVPYDIFTSTNLLGSNAADTVWNWLDVGYTCNRYTFTNQPDAQAFYILVPLYADLDGDGLPDWWELEHGLDPSNPDTGNTGVSDGYKDPDGDGWNNLQEYQNGTNPNAFNTPPAPQGFQVSMGAGGTNATLRWFPSFGSVSGYTIERSFTSQTIQVSSSVTQLADNTATLPTWLYQEFEAPQYRLRAAYAGGSSAWTPWTMPPECRAPQAQTITANSGQVLVAATGFGDAAALRVGKKVYDVNSYPVSVTNIDLSRFNFTNGIATVPEAFAAAVAGDQGFAQWVSSNGVPSAATATGWPGPLPFWDGREQLKQNLIFLLRSATVNQSFGYEYGDEDWPYYFVGTPTNYAYSSFHEVSEDGQGHPIANRDEFLPFSENYRYRNFVFSSTNLFGDGWLDTGVNFAWPFNSGWYYGLSLIAPELFEFHAPAQVVAVPSLLSPNQSQWTFWHEFWPVSYNPPGGDWAEIGITQQGTNFVMQSGYRNLFGLSYQSVKLAWGSNSTEMAVLNAGGSVARFSCYFYPETAQPAFQSADYYFGRASVDPLPGHVAFSTTNRTAPLITHVGTSIRLAGYAKLAITNGYSDKFGYLGQYFDKAYRMTNGVATTNQTGILSPYGEFFPTEPGPTALVTMPDIDTGQRGTGTVNVIKLQLDVNHDGVMDLPFAGPDNTSAAKPFVFWVNNDWDISDPIGSPGKDRTGAVRDWDNSFIESQRDLEDFTRLWICGMPALPTNQNYSVTLSMSAQSGNPAINLFGAVETNGGTGYLTNTNVAAAQLAGPAYSVPGWKITTISPSQAFTFPAGYFTNAGNKYFLFEGAGTNASGELVLTISQGTNLLARTSAWLDLHDVKDFYERAVLTNTTSGVISNWSSGVQTVQQASSSALGDDNDLILFVHGINVSVPDWLTESDTVFKRLYWSGFHGKFATVKWPCNYLTPPSPVTVDVINLSELKGYKSSTALTNYLAQLHNRNPGCRLNLLVHSQGNTVVSEAIRQSVPFDTYILSQAALPDSAYDVNAPTNAAMAAEDTGTFITPEWQPMGYHGIYTNLTGRIVNFFNPQDGVLNLWVAAQKIRKPSLNYYYDGTNTLYNPLFGSSYTVTDPQESRAMVSRSRTLSIGASGPASGHGVIQSAVDLNAQYGFNNSIDEHSAQWTRPIQTSRPYYLQVLESIKP